MSIFDGVRDVMKNILEPFALKRCMPEEGFPLFIKEAMPHCPLCGGTMSGHLYQQVACLAVKEGNAEKLQEFFEAYELNQWDKFSQFQEWNGTLDNAVAWLFQCPDDCYVLTIIYDPFELYESASLLRQKQVDANDLPLLQNDWQRVESAASFVDQ